MIEPSSARAKVILREGVSLPRSADQAQFSSVSESDLTPLENLGTLSTISPNDSSESGLRFSERRRPSDEPLLIVEFDQHDINQFRLDYDRLTDREIQVLRYQADGKNVYQSAAILGISHATVKAHIRSIHRKLHLDDRDRIMKLLYASGLIETKVTGVDSALPMDKSFKAKMSIAAIRSERIRGKTIKRQDMELLELTRAVLRLSDYERRVIELIMQDLTTEKIAETMSCSLGRIAGCLEKLYRKLGVPNRQQLIAKLLRCNSHTDKMM